MKILIYTMYFAPEPVGIAPMASDLAVYLEAHGWDVQIVAGMPKLPAWEIYEGYRGKWFLRERNIFRAWVYVPRMRGPGQMPAWRRILHDTSIALSGLAAARRVRRPDLILSITPPLQLAVSAIVLKKCWRRPLVNWIQDIVPDTALNVGMLRDGMTVALSRKLERFVYAQADQLAVISQGMRTNLIKKRVPAEKIVLATNWADPAPFVLAADRTCARKKLGLAPEEFVLLYGGSFSAKQVLENVVRAMSLLQGHSEIRALFVGDGIRLAAVRREIARLGVRTISFPGILGPEAYAQALIAADLLILNQSRELIDALTPSKLLTYWLAARPVLAAVNPQSEAAILVRQAAGGVVVTPEHPESFAEAVMELKSRPELLKSMGESGYRYVERNYTKDIVLSRFEAFLKSQYHS